jgi:hypothetical protein
MYICTTILPDTTLYMKINGIRANRYNSLPEQPPHCGLIM